MTDREKVIKGLEYCQSACVPDDCECCPFGECSNAPHTLRITPEVHDAILALLKAQEPRVMTLTEALERADDLCWIEINIDGGKRNFGRWTDLYIGPDCESIISEWAGGKNYMDADTYGKTWRCWTSRPTEEQREATPWQI